MGWTLHMIMCVLPCYPVSFHMLQLLLTGCPISSLLTSDQKSQLSTPSYKIKKEKRDAKKSATLVDPTTVSVVGVMDGQGTIKSPGLSASA